MESNDECVGPNVIILDTSAAMVSFHNKIFNLEMSGFLTKEEIVSGLISYLHDEQTAYGSVLEYSRDFVGIFESSCSFKDIHEFTNAVNELGADIIKRLQEIGAYDETGALWYEFHEFCGDDIVLKLSTLCSICPPRNSK